MADAMSEANAATITNRLNKMAPAANTTRKSPSVYLNRVNRSAVSISQSAKTAVWRVTIGGLVGINDH